MQSKFLSFYQYAKIFNSDTFDYDALQKTDFVFMRYSFKVEQYFISSWLISNLIY